MKWCCLISFNVGNDFLRCKWAFIICGCWRVCDFIHSHQICFPNKTFYCQIGSQTLAGKWSEKGVHAHTCAYRTETQRLHVSKDCTRSTKQNRIKGPFNQVTLIFSQCYHQTESKCHKGAQGLNNYPCEERKSLIGGKLSLQLLWYIHSNILAWRSRCGAQTTWHSHTKGTYK